MQQIGSFMDPVQVPISFRDTVLRHRWLGDQPSFSLRTIARRHTDQDSVSQRFLSYNTFLMRVRIALAKALADFAGPGDVLKALGVDPHDVVKKAGKAVCNVLPFPANEGCKAASNVIGFILDHISLDKALNAAFDALGAEAAIEFMLNLVGIPDDITIERKPALFSRSIEIGDILKADPLEKDAYDIGALCEVWTKDVRDSLLDHWGISNDSKHLALGKTESNVYVGDGLLFGSKDGRIVEKQHQTYKTRGVHRNFKALDMLADDELFAQKGALLIRINMGVGIIDLYLTHLYFGTGLLADAPWWVVVKNIPGTERPTNEEREAVRSAQLAELSKFIQKTHRPENIAMLCGDFNIDGNKHDAKYAGFTAVQKLMTDHNLVNAWLSPLPQPGDTDPGDTGGNFKTICDKLQAGDNRFCEDPSDMNGGYRIDYILVERPQAQHSFMLDVTRVRRRPFARKQATDDQAFMSDHLGLDCRLLASRK